MSLPVTKIDSLDASDITLTFDVPGIEFWMQENGEPYFYYAGGSDFYGLPRGELPNTIDVVNDPLNWGTDLQFVDEQFYDGFPFYDFRMLPWYFSDGENVRFEQDEDGESYLTLQGRDSETMISLDLISTGVGLLARPDVEAPNITSPENYLKWNHDYTLDDYIRAADGTDPETLSEAERAVYAESFALEAEDIAVGLGYVPTVTIDRTWTVSDSIADELPEIMQSVAQAGGDVFGTDADETLAVDAQETFDYLDGWRPERLGPLEGTYDLGGGSDTYDISRTQDDVRFDVVIDDSGGENDELQIEIGPDDEVTLSWQADAETRLFDLVIEVGSEDTGVDRFLVKGQSAQDGGAIERFDLGDLGTFTATELLEAFPPPFKEVTVEDTENEFDWAYYTEVTDDEGTPIWRDYVYDDGREETVLYDNGVPTTSTVTDPDDAYNWDSTTYTYDENGQVTEKVHLLDDGRSAATTFVDGVRTEQEVTDTKDAHGWEMFRTTYDENGQKAEIFREWDDGRTSTLTFENGIRSEFKTTDHDDAHNWESNHVVYDEDGNAIEQTYTLDNGREASTKFDAGQRTEQVVVDSDNSHAWEMYRTTYDENGQKAEIFREWDDGRTSTLTFENGIRSEFVTTDHDDAHDWESSRTLYDENGKPTSMTRDFDDGRSQVVTYENGQRSEEVTTDVDNAYDWLTITKVYDENGDLETYNVVEDDAPEEDLLLI